MIEILWENACNALITETYDIEIHLNEDEEDENYDENCFIALNVQKLFTSVTIQRQELQSAAQYVQYVKQKLIVVGRENNYEN